MGISIVHYQEKKDALPKWGVLNQQQKIVPLASNFDTLAQFLEHGIEEARTLAEKGSTLGMENVFILSPITRPCRLICQGLNYAEHRIEAQKDVVSDYNLFFRKDESSLTGALSPVKIPNGCQLFDYEIELGVVIGKPIREAITVTGNNIHKYVKGWIITNDFSARDMMFRATYRQWYRGKSARTLCPVGPILFIPCQKDWKRFSELKLTLTVNGEVRQEAKTSQMIFRPAETITEISQNIDLDVGDCILTGTPGGVALTPPNVIKKKIGELLFDEKKQVELLVKFNKQNKKLLKTGDVVECTIATEDKLIDLGVMKNIIE